jgi:hypothetical protein
MTAWPSSPDTSRWRMALLVLTLVAVGWTP